MGNMRHNLEIKRLFAKYGFEGYGIYNFVLESVTENLTTKDPIPDLKETCEDMAELYNGNSKKIEEIILWCIDQKLFEEDMITHKVLCSKIYKFLEQSQTRSEMIRQLIQAWNKTKLKELPESVTDKSDVSQTKVKEEEEEKEQEEEIYKCDFFKIDKTRHDNYKILFPNTNLLKEYQKANQWLIDNPNKRKSNYNKFITNWLNNSLKYNPEPVAGIKNTSVSHKKLIKQIYG